MSFREFLEGNRGSGPSMPLIHTTTFESFCDIIRSHRLVPKPCSVFAGEKLLYLFYGRPSYSVSKNITVSRQMRHYPVSIVLRPDSIAAARRIYPFDSGAYSSGLFKGFLVGLKLDKFEIGEFPFAPRRLVSAFYSTNKNYYFGNVRPGIDVPPTYIEVSAYLDLLNDTSVHFAGDTDSSDDRRQTIEIQCGSPVELKFPAASGAEASLVVKSTVLAVVLPQAILDDTTVRETVTLLWKAEPITYMTYRFTNVDRYHQVILEKIADFLGRIGVL
jgi:hypothetical protein